MSDKDEVCFRPLAIDLFCGAGGISEGLIQAGFDIVFSSDINEQVELTYRNRHRALGLIQGKNTFYQRADIKDLTGAGIKKAILSLDKFKGQTDVHIDAIFGGPPCQGFSMNGKRKGPDDPRNFLFREYVRVISELKPDYVVMENVQGFVDTRLDGFVGLSGTQYFNHDSLAPHLLEAELNLLDYKVLPLQILNAADYGVPQSRRRAIFIAYKRGLSVPKYPRPTNSEANRVSVMDAIGDLALGKKPRKLTNFEKDSRAGRTPSVITGKALPAKSVSNGELSKFTDVVAERFSIYKQGESTAELKKRIAAEGIDLSNKPALIDLCSDKLGMSGNQIVEHFKNGPYEKKELDVLLTKKNVRTRLQADKPSLTVVTIADDYIHPTENRTFSVRELARLQSFDDSFIFLGKRTTGGIRRRVEVPQYTQVGNAVPPLLAKAVAIEIINAIRKNGV